MPDLSFAPLLAEHRLWWSALRVRWLCPCGWEHRGPGDVAADAHDTHQDAVLLAEVARVLGSDEAVEASARAVAEEADDACFDRLVDEGYSDTDMEDADYWRSLARAALAALTTHLTGDTR